MKTDPHHYEPGRSGSHAPTTVRSVSNVGGEHPNTGGNAEQRNRGARKQRPPIITRSALHWVPAERVDERVDVLFQLCCRSED
jgi:hypothetical protein